MALKKFKSLHVRHDWDMSIIYMSICVYVVTYQGTV